MTPPNLTVADLNVLRAVFTLAHLRGRITNESFALALAAFDAAEHRLNDSWMGVRAA